MVQLTRLLLLMLGGLSCGSAFPQQDEEPDLDFLEYLGTWQESDEEWLEIAEMERQRQRQRVPEADGKPETDTDENDE